jgi:peptidoglycan hydrolase CwlO-like protein
MISCLTPNARFRRIGVWSSPLFAAVLLLVFLLVLPLFSPVQGDTLRQQLAQKQAALKQATAELDALQAELDRLTEAHGAAQARLAQLETDIVAVGSDIAQAEQDLVAVQSQLQQRLVDMYKGGPSWSLRYLEALLTETDLLSALERFGMLTKMANQDQELFEQVKGYLEESRVSKALLEEKKVEENAQMEELARLQEQMSAKLATAAAQYQSLKSRIATLKEEIRQADARAAAAAAAAAGAGSAAPGSTAAGSGSAPAASGSSAEADFIYNMFLAPRKSVLTGQMVMDIWAKYGISPAQSLTVLNAESGMGSLKYGGRLVSEANNFGCIRYKDNPVWLRSPPIPYGRVEVGGRSWFSFATPAEGMEAWARCISYGCGRDCYRPVMNSGNWVAFADIYYGKGVAGEAKYIARLQWAYGMLMEAAHWMGYNW